MRYKDVKLRALEPEDLELLYNWENNNDYWIISDTVSPFSKYTLKRYIENSHKNIYESGQLRLMIDYIPEKITIGTIDIFDFDPYHKRAGIGILIANNEYRRKGLATMALTVLIEYCFKTLLVHQLFCNILENNCESIELFRKLGFIEVGKKKDWIRTSEGYLSEIMFQLIKTEEG